MYGIEVSEGHMYARRGMTLTLTFKTYPLQLRGAKDLLNLAVECSSHSHSPNSQPLPLPLNGHIILGLCGDDARDREGLMEFIFTIRSVSSLTP